MLQRNPLNNPQGKNKKMYFLASCKGRDKVNGAGLSSGRKVALPFFLAGEIDVLTEAEENYVER